MARRRGLESRHLDSRQTQDRGQDWFFKCFQAGESHCWLVGVWHGVELPVYLYGAGSRNSDGSNAPPPGSNGGRNDRHSDASAPCPPEGNVRPG
jgi:hypothetical protein